MEKAFVFRFYPISERESLLRWIWGCVRLVYHPILAAREVSCVPLHQGLRHLKAAFINFFAGQAKYPNFKKKRNGGGAEFTKSAFKWKDGKVFLAKSMEPLNTRWSRQLPEEVEPSTRTVRLTGSGTLALMNGVYSPTVRRLISHL